jgi:predicted nucleic acid binding AN1-type Zn finger protein
MKKAENKKAKAAIKNNVAKVEANMKKAGCKDSSHIARALNAGWRKGSAAWFVQCRLNVATETIAKAIMKTEFKNQGCFSTLPKAKARINTLKGQAKIMGLNPAKR